MPLVKYSGTDSKCSDEIINTKWASELCLVKSKEIRDDDWKDKLKRKQERKREHAA